MRDLSPDLPQFTLPRMGNTGSMSPRRAKRRADDVRPLRDDLTPVTESAPDGEWVVRPVSASGATKVYRCPGCDQEIRTAVPHIVAWRIGEEDNRRHWHRACWEARLRRGVRVQRSRNAPRYG
jgi:hypothetical protein